MTANAASDGAFVPFGAAASWSSTERTVTRAVADGYGFAAGEELTIDYALFEGDEEDAKPWDCRCGSPRCRRRITARDWRLTELQERYRDHFSPFINRRIGRLHAVSDGPSAPPVRQAGPNEDRGSR